MIKISKVNRGKDFENQVKKGFDKVKNCTIDRLPDQMNGYLGSSNICDFTVYKFPFILYLECKACYGNTLNFHNISDNQWNGLLEKSKIYGAICGVMIWFIDHDITLFIDIRSLAYMRKIGKKSVNIKGGDFIFIEGKKKRIFFEYDMEKFLKHIGRSYIV